MYVATYLQRTIDIERSIANGEKKFLPTRREISYLGNTDWRDVVQNKISITPWHAEVPAKQYYVIRCGRPLRFSRGADPRECRNKYARRNNRLKWSNYFMARNARILRAQANLFELFNGVNIVSVFVNGRIAVLGNRNNTVISENTADL